MTPRLPWPVLSLFTLHLVLVAFATPRQAAAGPAEVLEQARHGGLEAGGIAPTHPFTTDGCSGGLSAAWQGSARLLPGLAATLGSSP
ncbi:MAG TPA: hypothetical protein VK997_15765, partial [Deferrisomatales bacterium]|nr:hypothetical protein [Deferrisomatales bacterium]